jgi:hypothetical protein
VSDKWIGKQYLQNRKGLRQGIPCALLFNLVVNVLTKMLAKAAGEI